MDVFSDWEFGAGFSLEDVLDPSADPLIPRKPRSADLARSRMESSMSGIKPPSLVTSAAIAAPPQVVASSSNRPSRSTSKPPPSPEFDDSNNNNEQQL